MSEDESLDAYMFGVGALRNVDGCGWACGLEGPHPAGALLSIVVDVSTCGSNCRRDARRHMGQRCLSLDVFLSTFEMRCVVTNVFVGMSRSGAEVVKSALHVEPDAQIGAFAPRGIGALCTTNA